MKKYLFLLVLVSSTLFCACSKDDDEFSLTDTVWQQVKEDGVIYTLTFKNGTCSYETFDQGTNISIRSEYTYTLDYPTVFLSPRKEGNANLKGNIADQTMSLINESKNLVIATLTKK